MYFLGNKKIRRAAGGLLPVLLLAGCGTMESTKAEYKTANRAKPLDVPPELSAPAKDDRYTVPEVGSKGTSFSSYLAERGAGQSARPDEGVKTAAPTVLPASDKLRIERAGSERWLVMAGKPAEVWPLLRRFVEARGLTIKNESPELGLLETDWVEKQAYVPQDGIRGKLAKAFGTAYSTSERERYRFRLESGMAPGTTEVFASHRAVEEVFVSEMKDETRWQPKAGDPGLEIEMLRRLVVFIVADEQKAALAAAPAQAGEKARFVERDGRLQLDIDERFDRAWRRVGLVLDRNGFTVDDRDRAKGLYFVRYHDPLAERVAVKKGFFDTLAFWREEAPANGEEGGAFRILVAGLEGDQVSRVEVQDKAGQTVDGPMARKILEVLRSDLK